MPTVNKKLQKALRKKERQISDTVSAVTDISLQGKFK